MNGTVRPMYDYIDPEPQDDTQPLRLLSIEELLAEHAQLRWLVKHVIPCDSVGMFFGGSGAFKSFVALDLALHVAHGMHWVRRKTRQGCVIYIAAEGGNGLALRVKAWHALHGLDHAAAQFRVLTVAVDILTDATALVDAANAIEMTPDLVIVDTMSQTFSGEENSATEVANYLRTIGREFRARWHCAVGIVHHSGHQATERPRGSSALLANLDWMYGVFRDGDTMTSIVESLKQKDGEKPEELQFTMHVETLGADEDGDAITSLAARNIFDAEEVMEIVAKDIRRGSTSNHSNIIKAAIQTEGQNEKQLREAFYALSDANEADKRKYYNRAKKWAITNLVISLENGVVRVIQRP